MSLDQPTPPDATQTANTQQGYNTGAAQTSQYMNMVNQQNPYGALTYVQSGTYPDGTPKYTAVQSLSKAQQGLLNQQQKNQAAAGGQVSSIIPQVGDQLKAGMNTDQDSIVKQLLGWQQNYMKPYFDQQTSNLNSQLAAQGITQGSEAYDNATRALQQNQTSSMENAMATDQAQAYQQAVSNYTTPLQAELGAYQSFYGNSLPANLTQNLVNTPQSQVAPADFSGLAEQNYQQQNQNYENTLNGLFAIPSALLGGWARGGGMSGLFGGK